MNNEQRKQLKNWIIKMEGLKTELENYLNNEQEKFDNIPENLQGSQRAQDSEDAIGCMEEAIELFDEIISIIEEIT